MGLRSIISQISTRIFLGPELSQNGEWQVNTKEYTSQVFQALRVIRSWPEWSRPYVHWFLKDCREARRLSRRAREIIEPIAAKRLEAVARAEKGLGEMPNDAITWTYQAAKGKDYHVADLQLALSMASVHTTSDLFSNVLLQLCRHREWIEPLRQEASEVLGEYGYEKTSLYRMKLADSVMKETQRIKPLGVRKFSPVNPPPPS